MKLTRRDAVVALAAGLGVGVGSAMVDTDRSETPGRGSLGPDEVDQLVAVADVVYPSEVTEHATFVDGYATGLPEARQQAISDTLTELDEYTRRTRGASLGDLSPAERQGVLEGLGVDRVGSDPEGSFPERVRYFVVNQLLYGLFTSPTGGQLVGISNPVGYPGGYESYQRPPSNAGEASDLASEWESDYE